MKVIVLGGGVIGVTTAYYLARAGAEVTLVDRQSGPAEETSFANAGQVSPGYSTPWAAPGIPLKALKWMFQKHAPLSIRPDGTPVPAALDGGDAEELLARALCGQQGTHDARGRIQPRLPARAARRNRHPLRAPHPGHAAAVSHAGAARRACSATSPCWRSAACPTNCSTAASWRRSSRRWRARATCWPAACACRTTRPATATCSRARWPTSRAGWAWTSASARRVEGLVTEGGRITGVRLGGPAREVLTADRYVLAFGSYSRDFAARLGLDIPVYPVKGYSLTVPLLDPAAAPQSTVLDETYKVAVTRFDDRIRVGGMAELGGFDLRLNPRRRETLERVITDLFPCGDLPRASFWTGLRPMTPDSTPIVGATPYRQPVPQHRPWHAGLDHGLRLRQAGGRPGDGTAARHPHRRPGDGPLPGARAPSAHRRPAQRRLGLRPRVIP